MASGMRSLRESGILKIFDGLTTIDEIVRETLAFD
jgi:type II secretory ATPase GspE/PulE/Tfp pilus assembly ATPase PilB-like protein